MHSIGPLADSCLIACSVVDSLESAFEMEDIHSAPARVLGAQWNGPKL